jgi:DNA polymerase-3 subunit gamma/tau
MSIYLDYRPKSFEEIVGNQTTVRTIKNKVKGKDPPHAIILHGPRGTGKTTTARIIASELGCNPKSFDFVELDAVQCGTIDAAREIRQNMILMPMESKCRVWLIDEAHGSSGKFQEGLLKALEDTPPHVYFILCTTNFSKIIATVKSRCMQFKFDLLNDKEIKQLLDWVLENEDVEINDKVVDKIINIAEGCPRESLVLLDQIIDLEPDQMMDSIQQTEDEREVRELCQALLKNSDWEDIVGILRGLKNGNPENIRRAILGWMSAVMLNDTSGGTTASRAALVHDCFREPVFYTNFPGIVAAAFNTLDEPDIPF